MRYLTLVLLMVFVLIPAKLAWAHAVILHSSLDDAPPRANRASEVHLTFNSDIETALSLVNLVSQGDRKHPLMIRKGKARGELVVDLPPLPPGEYALQVKVFAADGHLTEDILKFVVVEEH